MGHHEHGFGKGFLLGVAAGAAGAWFISEHRGGLKAAWWKLKIKADVYRKLKNLKKLTRDTYEDLVDDVLDRYRSLESIAAFELDEFADELKRGWREMKQRLVEDAQPPIEKDDEE